MKTIKYKTLVNFEGRNGFFKQSGLEVSAQKGDKRVSLFPLTSRGQIGRGMLEIPGEQIPEVMQSLAEAFALLDCKCVLAADNSVAYKKIKLEDGIYSYDCQKCGHSDLDKTHAELHQREHAPMLAALRAALSALNTARRFNVGNTTSYRIAADIERAIAYMGFAVEAIAGK